MAGPIPLHCIPRILYAFCFTKFVLAKFFPEIAQGWTDFCHSCKLSTDSGKVAGATEMWSYFMMGVLYFAVAEFGGNATKSQRKALQYGMIVPFAKLAVLAHWGYKVMGQNNDFYISVAENVIVALLSVLACYVWYKDVGKPEAPAAALTFTDTRTAVRVLWIEHLVYAAWSIYCLVTDTTNQNPWSDSGVFGAAMMAVNFVGASVCLMGCSQCIGDAQKKVIQYYGLIHKVVILYVLLPLYAPGIISGHKDFGLPLVYGALFVHVLHLVQLCGCCYPANFPKAFFWGSSFVCIFLGVLGLAYPTATAASIYRVPDLASAGEPVFRLIGLFLCLVGSSLYGFAAENNTEIFEMNYVYVYGFIAVWGMVNDMYLGLFTDLASVFLLVCAWRTQLGPVLEKLHLSMVKQRLGAGADKAKAKEARTKTGQRNKTPAKQK